MHEIKSGQCQQDTSMALWRPLELVAICMDDHEGGKSWQGQ